MEQRERTVVQARVNRLRLKGSLVGWLKHLIDSTCVITNYEERECTRLSRR